MSCAQTSLQYELHARGESTRQQDTMYCILTMDDCEARTMMCKGVRKLVLSQSRHPAVCAMTETRSVVVEKMLIITAMHIEPDFLAYLLDQPGVSTSAVSEFIIRVVPSLMERLMNGNMSIIDFVAEATHAYVKL